MMFRLGFCFLLMCAHSVCVAGDSDLVVEQIKTIAPPTIVDNGPPEDVTFEVHGLSNADGTVSAEWGAYAKKQELTSGQLDALDVAEGDEYVLELTVPIAAVDGVLYFVNDTDVHRNLRTQRKLASSAWWQNLSPLDNLVLKVYQMLYGTTPSSVTPPPLVTTINGVGKKVVNITVIINKVDSPTAPNQSPPAAPVTAPTDAPQAKSVPLPTDKPNGKPVPAPTDAPQAKPVPTPTEAPVAPPTDKPNGKPVPAPTDAPQEAPAAAPTDKPHGKPNPAPTDAPVDTRGPPSDNGSVPVPAPTFAPIETRAPPTGGNGPADTCTAQKDCVQFSVNPVNSKKCGSGDCEYQICLKIDESGACRKSGAWSHSCVKPEDACSSDTGFAAAMEVTSGVDDGYTQCQTVAAGGVAEFLLKDGKGCAAGDGASVALGSGSTASCAPRSAAVKSCTGNGVGVECVWTVAAPTSCGSHASSGGDPHFKLWNRTRYPFHGECDLVLLDNKDFNHGMGLDIHIRTTIMDFYSFIEAVAIRIGRDILEIAPGGRIWLNGFEEPSENLPATLSDFTINAPYREGSENGPEVIRIDLNNGDFVKVRSYKFLVSLDIFGLKGDFENSVGMLGDYNTGNMLARDGKTIITDPDAFGMEWQVTTAEPMLFRQGRAPVHPAKCTMPSISQTEKRRRLETSPEKVKEAEEVCAHKNRDDFSFCVFDVLATGDVGMAGAW